MRVLLLSLGLLVAAPALAQQGSLIEVDVSNLRGAIALDLGLDMEQIPATVAVPLGVASHACVVPQGALLSELRLDGQAGCIATRRSPDLNRLVQRKISIWR